MSASAPGREDGNAAAAGQTVLVVEDEAEIVLLIREALVPKGYVFVHARTCAEAWRYLESLRPALIVLDVGLPDGSGLDLCRRLREHPSLGPTPVIMLTGKQQPVEKLEGFAAGADHYLIKPFQIQELYLWVGALLKRIRYDDRDGGVLRVGDFVVDPQAHTVTAGAQIIRKLTSKEFDLLYDLMRLRPKVLSKSFIMSRLWHTVLRDNTVEVHIKNLRSKLGPAGERIKTVPKLGYQFV